MTDEELKNWESEDFDFDDLMGHFEDWGGWSLWDTAAEARRVSNVMFGFEIEYGSPIDELTVAAVAHANTVAYNAMAAALGVDSHALRVTIAEWAERKDNLPPPVSAQKLMEMIGETNARWRQRVVKHEHPT